MLKSFKSIEVSWLGDLSGFKIRFLFTTCFAVLIS